MDIVMTELLSNILFINIAPFILLSRSLPSGSFFASFICFVATLNTAECQDLSHKARLL